MATLTNGSFETGTFSSWTTLGTTAVRQGSVQLGGISDSNASFTPTDGSYFAQLTSQNQSVGSVESFFGLSSGYINANFDSEKNNTYTVGSAIKQTITVAAGQKLSFDWKFKSTDYWSYNDSAFYVSTGSTVKLASVYTAGNYGSKSGTFAYEFSAAGDYTIGVAVFNESDSGVDSYLGVDNFQLTGGLVNRAPSTASISRRINEDSSYTFAASDFSFSDPDSGDSLKAVLITSAPASGQLLYNGATFTIGSNGYSILKADLGKLSFAPAANANGDGYASFQFKVVDQSDAASTAATVSFDVTPVNDAPSTASITRRINEDSSYTFAASDFSFSDPDSGDLLKAVLITSAPASGQLLYNGATFTIGSSGYSILKADLGKLSFSPAANANGDGYASFQFKVVDQSDAVSTAATVSFDVTPVNDAPISLRLLSNLTAATESGVSPLGMALPASPSTGLAGSLFAEIQDIDVDPLSVVAIRSIDEQGTALDQDWIIISSTNKTIQGLYGNLTLRADGSYQYEVNDQLSALANLNDGLQLKEFFRLKVSDGQADPINQDFVIAINGRDEVAKPSIDVLSLDDRINRNERRNGITLTGSAPGASNVTVNWGTTQKLAAVVNGKWAATFTTTIDPQQTNPLIATVSEVPDDWQDGAIRISASDALGQKSLPVERKIIIDTVLPTMPQLNLVAGDDRVNALEKANGITLSGTAEAGSTVSLIWGDTTKKALVNFNGQWTIPIAPNEIAADGLRSRIKLTATDLAGNVSLTKNDFIKAVDTQLPATVRVDAITADNVINLAEYSKGITISGSTDRATKIQLAWDNLLFMPFVSASGKWTQSVTADQLGKLNRSAPMLITVTDSAGNSSSNPPIIPQFDLQAPTVPVMVPVGKSLNGKQVINAATKTAGVVVKGQAASAEAGSTVSITLGRTTASTNATADGSWQIVLAADAIPADVAAIQLQAQTTDLAGNTSAISSQTLLIDTDAPKDPKLQAVTGDDFITGIEAQAGITLQGTAEAGAVINVVWSSLQWSTITSADGKWNLGITIGDIAKLGSNSTIAIQATDLAGNPSRVVNREIKLALTPANAPKFDKVAGDDRINQAEAKAGITISGKADANSILRLNFAGKLITTTADKNGTWTTLLRSSSLPQSDGSYQLTATATNSSGIDSALESKMITLDRTTPTLVSSVLSGNQIRLFYSEELDNHQLSAQDFTVLEGQIALATVQAKVSQTNSRLVELSLIREPASTSTLSISYSPSTSNSASLITDASVNPAASFSKFSPVSIECSQSVTVLSDQYRELKLIGTTAINGIGNNLVNKITGNQANNVLEGCGGADILTGLGGSDVFRYTKMTDSLLTGFDQITDFTVGTDQIDGPNVVGPGDILNAGQASELAEAALQKILPTASFVASGAAIFSYGNRTFLALNDTSAGFSSSRDTLIEITGYSGNLQSLEIV